MSHSMFFSRLILTFEAYPSLSYSFLIPVLDYNAILGWIKIV